MVGGGHRWSGVAGMVVGCRKGGGQEVARVVVASDGQGWWPEVWHGVVGKVAAG